MTADHLLYMPPYPYFSPSGVIEAKAGPPIAGLRSPPPSSLLIPPFHAQPSILREEASAIVDDLGSLLRRYEGLAAERTRLKLYPGVSQITSLYAGENLHLTVVMVAYSMSTAGIEASIDPTMDAARH